MEQEQNTIQTGAEWTGEKPGEGEPGMLGARGTIGTPGIPEHTSPAGVPTQPGTDAASPGSVVPPGASSASTPSSPDVYARPGGIGPTVRGNLEGGTPGVPGTPVPGGPLRSDPTPPEMPDYGRAGEEGFEATATGRGQGVATGRSPSSGRPMQGVAGSDLGSGSVWSPELARQGEHPDRDDDQQGQATPSPNRSASPDAGQEDTDDRGASSGLPASVGTFTSGAAINPRGMPNPGIEGNISERGVVERDVPDDGSTTDTPEDLGLGSNIGPNTPAGM